MHICHSLSRLSSLSNTLLVTLFALLHALPGQCLTLTNNESVYPVAAEVSLLEDPGGELGLAEVSSPTQQTAFRRWSEPGDISLGFSESAYWLRLTLSRSEGAPSNWLIEIPYLSRPSIRALRSRFRRGQWRIDFFCSRSRSTPNRVTITFACKVTMR